MDFGLVVHGGAWDIPDEVVGDHLKGMRMALEQGFPMLKAGRSALEVIEAVVAFLEDDSTFDAGRGSFLNATGQVEMDAIIASDEQRIGAVAALQNIRNPVKVARALLEKDGPVMLVGEGANLFASEQGFESCDPEELLVGRELDRYRKIQENPDFRPKNVFGNPSHGTVGAVALDKQGNIAVAGSTGGTPKKPPGRVGDTPLFGAGAYIEADSIGVAATGYGEDLIKAMITKRVVEYYNAGNSVQEGAKKAITHLSNAIQGLGGVIALGKEGIGVSWNTPRMAFGVQKNGMEPVVGIEKEDTRGLSAL